MAINIPRNITRSVSSFATTLKPIRNISNAVTSIQNVPALVRGNIAQALTGDPPDAIERTVAAAEREILAVEESDLYDYGVQNDNESGALEQIATLADTHGRVAPAVCHLPEQLPMPCP